MLDIYRSQEASIFSWDASNLVYPVCHIETVPAQSWHDLTQIHVAQLGCLIKDSTPDSQPYGPFNHPTYTKLLSSFQDTHGLRSSTLRSFHQGYSPGPFRLHSLASRHLPQWPACTLSLSKNATFRTLPLPRMRPKK